MARYGKEHKEATRRRIIEAAGQRLKRDGIDGSGVSVLMADAGLTNGAFYAHFASKEELVATAVADQLRQQLERYRGRAPTARESSSWCASTCRSSTATTQSTAAHPQPCSTRSGAVATPPSTPTPTGSWDWSTRSRRSSLPGILSRRGGQTLSLFALLIGTLQLSRALADRQLADEVLERGIENALALLPGE